MKRLDKATYITHLRFAKPDANQFIRLQTVYLSQISESQLQTSDGIINLTLPYQGPKLQHNSCIMFLGRLLSNDHLQGMIKGMSAVQVFLYSLYVQRLGLPRSVLKRLNCEQQEVDENWTSNNCF